MDSALLGANLALSFLVTYLAHSTLLLGGAWLLSRGLKQRALPLQDLTWKVALVGGFVTAFLRVAAQALDRPTVILSQALSAGDLALLPVPSTPHPGLLSLAGQLAGWERLLLFGWAVGALAGLVLFARSWSRLHTCLSGRRSLESGPVRATLDGLLVRTGRPSVVRLSDASELPVPVALGVWKPEICLPSRAVQDLGEGGRAAVLAHELGHLVRRDPAWLLAARALESVFFIQPLNRLARRRLQVLSEYLADAWALSATGDRKSLAQCLVDVAEWLQPSSRGLAAMAPGMAGGRGQLTARVQRILGRDAADLRPVRWPFKLAFGFALGFIALFAPALAPPPLLDPAPALAPSAESSRTAHGVVATTAVANTTDQAVAEGVGGGVIAARDDDAREDGVAGALEDWDGEDSPDLEDAAELDSALDLGGVDWNDGPGLEAALAQLGTLGHLERLGNLGDLGDLGDVGDLGDLGALAERFEAGADRFPPARGSRPSDEELERFRAAAEHMARRTLPSKEAIERLQEQARALAERSRLTEQQIEELRAAAQELAKRQPLSEEQVEELRQAARELAQRQRATPEQIARLRQQAQRLAERRGPSPEAVAELQRKVREMVLKATPNPEQVEELRREARRMSESSRKMALRDMEREKLTIRREVAGRLRREGPESMARSLESQERELEEALARIRELRSRLDREHQEPAPAEPPHDDDH